MKLQLALDTDLKTGVKVTKKTSEYVDIIEIGTPLVKREGMGVVRKFKKFKKPIMADLKTMDTGSLEAEMAFKEGAEITSVCGASDIDTIAGAVKAAKKNKKETLVDLINVKNKNKIKKIIDLKPDYVCTHTGIDMQNQGMTPFEDLKKLQKMLKESKNRKTKVSVAGGINLENIDQVIKQRPDVVIVGGAITKADNPKEVVKELKEKIKQ